jgi:hypothetical protein
MFETIFVAFHLLRPSKGNSRKTDKLFAVAEAVLPFPRNRLALETSEMLYDHGGRPITSWGRLSNEDDCYLNCGDLKSEERRSSTVASS